MDPELGTLYFEDAALCPTLQWNFSRQSQRDGHDPFGQRRCRERQTGRLHQKSHGDLEMK